MYEMYPLAWGVADAQPSTAERPRRRPRKVHSILPALIVRLEAAGADRPLG